MRASLLHLVRLERPLDPVRRRQLVAAASHPSSMSEEVRAALPRLGLDEPAPTIARPLLLAAREGDGSLWTLDEPHAEGACRMADDTARAWALAGRLAAHALPLVADPARLIDRGLPGVRPLSPSGGASEVRGESFGLAFLLAHLSRGLGIAIPADVAATARLTPDGVVHAVDRLEEKFAALRDWAPAVRRVLVAAEQEAEAKAAAAEAFEVVACATVDDAWPAVFSIEALERALREHWSDPAVSARAARAMFRLALDHPRGNLDWKAVARASDVLAELSASEVRWRAEVAAAIAWRHAGPPRPLPVGPTPTGLPHPDRVALHAHEVQAANDGVRDDWRAVADAAERDLPAPGHEHPDDLKLVGALGRLYAAWGELDLARARLELAARVWLELDRPDEASYPLTELLRVLGLQGAAAAVSALEVPAALLDGRGGAYLRLARGRAYAQCGDTGRARAELAGDAADWDDAPVHVRASRLRWLARIGPAEPPLAALRSLAHRDPLGAGFAWCLARADGGDLVALAELDPGDAAQLARCRAVAAAHGGTRPAEDWFPY